MELEQIVADVESGRLERDRVLRCMRLSVEREHSARQVQRTLGADLVSSLWIDWQSRRYPVRKEHLDQLRVSEAEGWEAATRSSLSVLGHQLQVVKLAADIKTDSWIGDSAPVAMLFLRDHPKPALAVILSTKAVCSYSPVDRETAARVAELMLFAAISRRITGKPVSDGLYWAGQGSIRRLDVRLRRSWLGRPRGLDDPRGELDQLFS